MVKKLILSLLIVASVSTTIPIGASAAWKKDNGGLWYTQGETYSTGWRQIDGSWYYFGNDGYMKTGWVQDGSAWYYLNDSGIMITGKVTIQDKAYEFDSTGKWIDNSVSNGTASTNISTPPSEDKLRATPNYSWFNENGNTYFKVENNLYLKAEWKIDGYIYFFDSNGVLQKGEYTALDGNRYLSENDGKIIKCLNDDKYILCASALTTKSSTNNYVVKLDDSDMMDITGIYSSEPEKNGVIIKGKTGYCLDKTQEKPTVEGKTLYCKTNQCIDLGTIKVNGIESKSSLFPNLVIGSDSTDRNIVDSGINLSLEDGFLRNIHPVVIAKKVGNATITINVNMVKTSFDVVVTE